jgi:uncharacterized protein
MKKILLVLLMLLNIASYSAYKVPTPFPNTDVHDYIGLLQADNKATLNKAILNMRANSVEMAIIILQDLQGYDITDASLAIGREWGVGKKGINNGIVYILVPSMRKARLEIGPGLQGDLPDIICNRMQDAIKPYYRKGEYYEGMLTLLQDINTRMSPAYKEQQRLYKIQKQKESDGIKEILYTILIAIGVCLLILGIYLWYWYPSRKQCEIKRLKEGEELNKLTTIKYITSCLLSEEQLEKDKETLDFLNKEYESKYNKSLSHTIEKNYNDFKTLIKKISSLNLNSLSNEALLVHKQLIRTSLTNWTAQHDRLKNYISEYYTTTAFVKKTIPILPDLYEKAKAELKNTPYTELNKELYVKLCSLKQDEYFENYGSLKLLIVHYDKIINYRAELLRKEEDIKRRNKREEEENEKRRKRNSDSYSSGYSSESNYSSSSSSSNSDSGNYGGGSFDGGGSDSSW